MNIIESWHDYVSKNKDIMCKPQLDLIKHIGKLIRRRDIIYIEKEALMYIDFIEEFMTQTVGINEGEPLKLLPWQKYGMACVFGIKEKESNLRYFNLWLLIVAKKSGKSELAAAIALAILFIESVIERGAEIYIMSGAEDQAKHLYEACMTMVRNSPELLAEIGEKNVQFQGLFYKQTKSYLKVLTAKALTKEGFNPLFYIVDELHVILDSGILDILKRGQGARMQGLGMITTTAPEIPNDFYDTQYNLAKDILSGKNKVTRMFPQIFEADMQDPWDSDVAIYKANPSVNVATSFRNLSIMRDEAKMNPDDYVKYCSKQINRPMNSTSVFLTRDILIPNAKEITKEMYYDTYGLFAIDMSATTDLTCATALIPLQDRSFLFLQKYFMAENRLENNSKEDKKEYWKFIDTEIYGNKTDEVHKELLYICRGSSINVDDILEWYFYLEKTYQITFQKIGYDDFRTKEVGKAFTNAGLGSLLYDVKYQPAHLTNVIKLSEALFQDKKLIYSKWNSLFLWCAENVLIKSFPGGGLLPDKSKSRGRIDGYSSLVMALKLFELMSDFFEEFVFESR